MTENQVKQQLKATALNAIRKMYNPYNYENGNGLRSNRWDEGWAEQRNTEVKRIIEKLEENLEKVKLKYKAIKNNKNQTN